MVTIKNPPSLDYGPEVDHGGEVDLPAVNARQGVINHNVRYVLALGLGGAVIAFALVLLFLH
jgi:hypothetical protein